MNRVVPTNQLNFIYYKKMRSCDETRKLCVAGAIVYALLASSLVLGFGAKHGFGTEALANRIDVVVSFSLLYTVSLIFFALAVVHHQKYRETKQIFDERAARYAASRAEQAGVEMVALPRVRSPSVSLAVVDVEEVAGIEPGS